MIQNVKSIEDADRVFKAQKLTQLMGVMSQQDPSYVTLEDRYNAYQDFLESFDNKDADRYSTNPQEVLQDQSVQLQQQVAQLQQQAQLMQEKLIDTERNIEKAENQLRKKVIKVQEKDPKIEKVKSKGD